MADGVRLPRLTREELFAVGDKPVLIDSEDQAWWDGIGEASRAELVTAAQRGLVARDLARPNGDKLDLDGRLTLILGARSAPAWIAVASGLTQMRVYGMDMAEGPYALLEHRPVPGVANFVGMRLQPAVEAITAFLLRAPEPGEDTSARRLEVMHPKPDEHRERRLVVVGPRQASMAPVSVDGVAGDYSKVTSRSLTKEVTRLIAR
jgi:hypothetical protein